MGENIQNVEHAYPNFIEEQIVDDLTSQKNGRINSNIMLIHDQNQQY